MEFSRVDLFFLMIFPIIYIEAGLNPEKDSVCLKTITYNETIKVKVNRPASKVDKIMCWNEKKYCDEEITVDLKEPRVITRTKILASCCEGYEEDKKGNCIPVCPKGCGSGKCVAPGKCTCEPGFFGSECEKICDKGKWGENCLFECNCSENHVCDKILGCVCTPGWIGLSCKTSCPVGYYGFLCQEKCLCTDSFCNHITGKCIDSKEAFNTLGEESKMNERQETRPSNASIATNQTQAEFIKVQDIEFIESNSSADVSQEKLFDKKFTATVSESDENVTLNPTYFKSDEVEEREKEKELMQAESSTRAHKTKFKDLSDTGQVPKSSTIFNTHGSTKGIDILKELRTNLTALGENILQTKELFNPVSNTAVKSVQSSRVSNFIPTFTVLSGVTVLIILIAAKWLIITFRKKIKKMTNLELGYFDEEFNILSGEKFTWENNMENPVCVTDIINTVPTLQTFKPEMTKTSNSEKMKNLTVEKTSVS